MPSFETIMKKAELVTIREVDGETTTLKPVVRLHFEIPMDSEIWEFVGGAAGEVVRVDIEQVQRELPL